MPHISYQLILTLTVALTFTGSAAFAQQLAYQCPASNSINALTKADPPPMPEVRLRLPVSELDKARVANRLLIGGGLCLVVGVPVLAYGLAHLNRKPADPGNVEGSNYRSYMPYVASGSILTAAGLGMGAPGLVLKIRYGHDSKRR